MSKNVEWKNSSIDYDKLNQLSHTQLMQSKSGKQTIAINRTKESCSNGGKKGGKTTGEKIKNGEKIGFYAIPMEERIEKYYSKPREYRRILSEDEMMYIRKVYVRVNNQFEKIPKGKKRLKELMDMFNVSKGTILRIVKNNYKK